jgi:pimeloyl-ACP methyl ester carboxylesterase
VPDNFRFEDRPVSWQVDEIDVDASLTRPDGDGPFPAIIMVAGSGPTDRNWNSPLIPGTNGSAALLAQAFTAQGFITLRYDKRASGPNAPQNVPKMLGKINLQGHLEELAGGVELLAGRDDVDAQHIFALSNSEGAVHVLNYQAQKIERPLAGLILTAPMGRPAGVVARSQIAAQIQPLPGGNDLMAVYDAAMADFAAGRPVKVEDNLPEGLRNLLLGVTTPINQPFARELWMFDPLAMLARVTAPVLIVIGKQDIQVDWQADGSLFEAMLKDHGNIQLVYAEHANHVLKYEPRNRSQLTPAEVMQSYGAADTRLDDDVLKAITDWLNAHR